jgi:Helix-turn-helix domain
MTAPIDTAKVAEMFGMKPEQLNPAGDAKGNAKPKPRASKPRKGGGDAGNGKVLDNTELFAIWKRLRADRSVSPSARLVWNTLAFEHHNKKDGRCDPGYTTLAKNAGVGRRTAIAAIPELEKAGLITVQSIGGGPEDCTNRYGFVTPRCLAAIAEVKAEAGAKAKAKARAADHGRGARTAPLGDNDRGAEYAGRGAETAHEPLNQPRSGCCDSEGDEVVATHRGGASPSAPPAEEGNEDKFRRLEEVWSAKDLPSDMVAAKKAFADICTKHDGERVIASAGRWVETLAAAGNLKYLPKLELWLTDGRWRKDPPGFKTERDSKWPSQEQITKAATDLDELTDISEQTRVLALMLEDTEGEEDVRKHLIEDARKLVKRFELRGRLDKIKGLEERWDECYPASWWAESGYPADRAAVAQMVTELQDGLRPSKVRTSVERLIRSAMAVKPSFPVLMEACRVLSETKQFKLTVKELVDALREQEDIWHSYSIAAEVEKHYQSLCAAIAKDDAEEPVRAAKLAEAKAAAEAKARVDEEAKAKAAAVAKAAAEAKAKAAAEHKAAIKAAMDAAREVAAEREAARRSRPLEVGDRVCLLYAGLPGTVIVPGDHSLVRFDRAFADQDYPEDKQREHSLPRDKLVLLFEGEEGFATPPQQNPEPPPAEAPDANGRILAVGDRVLHKPTTGRASRGLGTITAIGHGTVDAAMDDKSVGGNADGVVSGVMGTSFIWRDTVESPDGPSQ